MLCYGFTWIFLLRRNRNPSNPCHPCCNSYLCPHSSPKRRHHYYAHLKEIKTTAFSRVTKNETTGLAGTTRNAKGKPPHLYYAIVTVIPYLWCIDGTKQGWKKMFYLNPVEFLNSSYKTSS